MSRKVKTTPTPKDGRDAGNKGRSYSFSLLQSDSEDESEPCAECNEEISSFVQALRCDLCEHWFCNKNCIKLSNEDYNRVGKSKDNDGVMWFCKH